MTIVLLSSKRLAPYWKDFDPKNMPENITFPEAFGSERPDVWINPEKYLTFVCFFIVFAPLNPSLPLGFSSSLIAQVKASEIVPAKNYSLGYTLRFPRLVKIRDDKTWVDCMTASEVEGIRRVAEGRLTTKTILSNNFRSTKKSKAGPFVLKQRGVTSVAPHFEATDISGVKKTGATFQGLEICLIFLSFSYLLLMLVDVDLLLGCRHHQRQHGGRRRKCGHKGSLGGDGGVTRWEDCAKSLPEHTLHHQR